MCAIYAQTPAQTKPQIITETRNDELSIGARFRHGTGNASSTRRSSKANDYQILGARLLRLRRPLRFGLDRFHVLHCGWRFS
jgi:hypothetical protein